MSPPSFLNSASIMRRIASMGRIAVDYKSTPVLTRKPGGWYDVAVYSTETGECGVLGIRPGTWELDRGRCP